MKFKDGRWRRLVCVPRIFVLIAAMIVSSIIPGVYPAEAAVDYVYMAANPNNQYLGATQNYVMRSWFDGQLVRWYTADGAVLSYINQAITEWEGQIPEVDFSQTSLESDAHLIFETGTESDCGGPASAFLQLWEYDANYDAYFLTKAEICLALGRVAEDHKYRVVAHEMGHVIGLHDRYDLSLSPSECNPDDTSIMDTADLISNVFYLCDAVTFFYDGERARGIVKEGQMLALDGNELVGGDTAPRHFNAVPGSSSTAVKFIWEDWAWSENWFDVTFHYWDSATSSWVHFTTLVKKADTGVHQLTEDRILSREIDRTLYGTPGNTYYTACGNPVFDRVNGQHFGEPRCSQIAWISGP